MDLLAFSGPEFSFLCQIDKSEVLKFKCCHSKIWPTVHLFQILNLLERGVCHNIGNAMVSARSCNNWILLTSKVYINQNGIHAGRNVRWVVTNVPRFPAKPTSLQGILHWSEYFHAYIEECFYLPLAWKKITDWIRSVSTSPVSKFFFCQAYLLWIGCWIYVAQATFRYA